MRKIRFNITVKSGAKTLALVTGLDKDPRDITVADIGEAVIAAEQFLERLTGLRFHIDSETVEEESAFIPSKDRRTETEQQYHLRVSPDTRMHRRQTDAGL